MLTETDGSSRSKELVFLVDGDKAKMVEVTTDISDFDNIEIVEGVSEGQQVISGPYFIVSKDLSDGELIKVINENKPAETD